MFRNRFTLLHVVLFAAAPAFAFAADQRRESGEDGTYAKTIRPLLVKLCFDCHGVGEGPSQLRLDQLDTDFLAGGNADTWHDVLNQLNLGEMPPDDAKRQPSAAERELLTHWLTRQLRAAAEAKRRAGGRVSARRLTRYEYASTMRGLLGIEYDFARELPPEPASSDGFLNEGATLEMSPAQVETYLSMARRGLSIAIVEGEAPSIHRHRATKTAVGQLPRRKDGGAMPVNPEFILDVPTFPRSGEFEIQVVASAILPSGVDFPQMRVSLGCVPGIVHVPRKLVGHVDVTAPHHAPQTFTFRGRMEDYPQSGDREFGNVAFNGVIVLIDYLDADGNELRYPERTYSDPPPKAQGKPAKQGTARKARPASSHLPPLEAPRVDVTIHSVAFTSPTTSQWPPKSHQDLLRTNAQSADELARVREILGRFIRNAWRRPPTSGELRRHMELYSTIRKGGDDFVPAIRETMAAALVSPHFLYLQHSTDAHSVAARLAYFLTASPPDEQLSMLADTGELLGSDGTDRSRLAREAERLIASPPCTTYVNQFADQWFDLGGLDRVAINPEFYPDFDNGLKDAMKQETRGFLAHILTNNLSCLELIDSDWTIVNRALANHYGLTRRPRSSEFERVSLSPADRRGGILNHGSFLVSNSSGESSHPIKRAVWVLDRLLASPPPPPPPDVPDLDAERADLRGLTLKQQLEAHRERESCNQCHRKIDPWGVALEHYDAVGSYRTRPVRKPATKPSKRSAQRPQTDRDASRPTIDASTVLPNGKRIHGAEQLKQHLRSEHRESFARAIVERLATYALGRTLDFADQPELDKLTTGFIADNLRLRGLIVALVTSDLFISEPTSSQQPETSKPALNIQPSPGKGG